MPPGNANAALAKRRREKLTGLPEDKAGSGFAQGCTHPVTRTERLSDCHQHYARLRWGVCGRYLRWLPQPETIEGQKLNAFKLAKLAMCDRLNPWERRFVADMSRRNRMSPRQHEIVERLCRDYLEAQS